MIKIAMWSGPRNISTALMRSFENRPDTYVSDAPFYAHYLYITKKKHPMYKEIIHYGDTNWNSVVKNITGNIPYNKKVWYQKHMAQHNLQNKNLNWIRKMKNILLIRNPKEVILSYIKKNSLINILELGYIQQVELVKKIEEDFGIIPIIIDSQDLLKNPKYILTKLCKKCNISFYDKMLLWPKGPRKTDGIWSEYWYTNVENSTRFSPYIKNNSTLPMQYKNIFLECMNYYTELYEKRIK